MQAITHLLPTPMRSLTGHFRQVYATQHEAGVWEEVGFGESVVSVQPVLQNASEHPILRIVCLGFHPGTPTRIPHSPPLNKRER